MQVDVAVIGGGPAGCSAALTLRAQGYSVAVVAVKGRTEKPTETAAPQLRQLLHSIDAESALLSCEPCFGICSSWGRYSLGLRPSMINPLGHAWFVHRERFDSRLRDLARGAGANWIDERAHRVVFGAPQATLVTSGATIHARWLILATGSPTWPARMTQQKVQIYDFLAAFWARVPTKMEARLLFVEPVDDGWWYLCPDDGRGVIACFVTDATAARKLHPGQISNWTTLFRATNICQQLETSASATRVHVAPAGLAELPREYGSQWVAVGDAAVRLDPLGSSGTATAIGSGIDAARAVGGMLRGDSKALEKYARWRRSLFIAFTRQRAQQYAVEGSRRDGDFWPARAREA